MPKTAPFSSSVAFLTPPTFPAPAPRKRFFDPLPKKILGFRTRKGRLPRRQYLARARLEFRAGLRVVVSSRARAFGISCGLLAGGAVGWLASLAVDGSRWRCACAPARHGIPARACAFGISCARPAGGAGGWLAVLPTAGAVRRPADRLPAVPTAAPIGAAHPDRLPPVDDLPPRPPAAPVCRSAAGQAGAAADSTPARRTQAQHGRPKKFPPTGEHPGPEKISKKRLTKYTAPCYIRATANNTTPCTGRQGRKGKTP